MQLGMLPLLKDVQPNAFFDVLNRDLLMLSAWSNALETIQGETIPVCPS
jgi:hypothetical protein